LPRKFEAGVPNMAGAIGLGAAIQYINKIGIKNIEEHLEILNQYTLQKLLSIDGLTLFGPTDNEYRGSVFSFALSDIHPHDAGQVLDQYGIAVRTGHHCAWPLMKKFGLSGTTRASLYLYNDESDVDALVDGIYKTKEYFAVK
jgi:cysteine desulfurase/selenocysteine lyase